MRLFLILLTALSFNASAEVYKWTDADGNVHFGSQPPPGQQQEVKIRNTTSSSSVDSSESDIMRQVREIEQRKRNRDAEQRYQSRVSEIRENQEARPDYICQGAKDRLKSAKERWEDKQVQGWTLSEKRYHEQRIRDRQRHVNNICR